MIPNSDQNPPFSHECEKCVQGHCWVQGVSFSQPPSTASPCKGWALYTSSVSSPVPIPSPSNDFETLVASLVKGIMLPFLKTALDYTVRWAPAILTLFGRPRKENPTVTGIEDLQRAEKAKQDAEKLAQEYRDLAEQMRKDAAEERKEARIRQEKADEAAARATQDIAQMREQMEESARIAKHAAELSQEASRASKEDAERLRREAQQERERARKMEEDAKKVAAEAREEAKRAQQAADEQRREAEAVKARADQTARAAAEETRKANEAKADAERRLKEGIQPVVTPTPQELAAAKRRIQYREDYFHFAVAGISGSGKSSLVNAFRGLRVDEAGAAAVGVTETTLQTTRYQDQNPENRLVWYDVPGAGTLKCRDWQYFNDQGLYVFDCIVVLFDNRFTMTDIAILTNAKRFKIPTYIVRSKADQHIRNIMRDKGYDSDDEDDVERRNQLYKAAKKQFVDSTRRSVKTNLEDANLPDQRVYIIANTTLLSVVRDRTPKKTIDEVELVNDLFNEAYRRRKADPVA